MQSRALFYVTVPGSGRFTLHLDLDASGALCFTTISPASWPPELVEGLTANQGMGAGSRAGYQSTTEEIARILATIPRILPPDSGAQGYKGGFKVSVRATADASGNIEFTLEEGNLEGLKFGSNYQVGRDAVGRLELKVLQPWEAQARAPRLAHSRLFADPSTANDRFGPPTVYVTPAQVIFYATVPRSGQFVAHLDLHSSGVLAFTTVGPASWSRPIIHGPTRVCAPSRPVNKPTSTAGSIADEVMEILHTIPKTLQELSSTAGAQQVNVNIRCTTDPAGHLGWALDEGDIGALRLGPRYRIELNCVGRPQLMNIQEEAHSEDLEMAM
ncbi:hypothetical protein FA95DRAFT_1612512 [Auriscalpium vulgare]|uniref:Uncharacterized protein n=1 Tax=Auriscalpium vulgare TaxID=40419 RepID=A0ACB8R5W9_9AGAM|nr:hypothetical protein FA95DRAFT_1612512 [Auriscalpium vulgare]